MIRRCFRVIIGFVLACLAAGLAVVLFVYTPLELAGDLASERLVEVGLLALAAATHSAVFAAPFALIGAVIGEWLKIGSWMYYVLVAIAIAAVGFTAQFWTEAAGEATIVNNYAVTAFIVTGFVAGLVYWLFAGRYAAGEEPEIMQPTRPAPPSSSGNGPSARTAI
jgi:MFS family permease